MTGTLRSKHVSLVLRSLHWLLVWQHIVYKMAMLVHNLDRQYLADDCWWASCRPPRRTSADFHALDIRRARIKNVQTDSNSSQSYPRDCLCIVRRTICSNPIMSPVTLLYERFKWTGRWLRWDSSCGWISRRRTCCSSHMTLWWVARH